MSNNRDESLSSASDGERIVLGKLMRAQGLDGGIRFLPYYGDAEHFSRLNLDECVFYWSAPVSSPGASLRLKVKSYRPHQQFIILNFAGYDDIDSVRCLTNGEISIDASMMWDPDEGEFREYELIGMKVFNDESGDLIGIVSGLDDGMAHSYLRVVPAEEGKKEFVIPFVAAMILNVSRESKEIRVSIPDGLMDL